MVGGTTTTIQVLEAVIQPADSSVLKLATQSFCLEPDPKGGKDSVVGGTGGTSMPTRETRAVLFIWTQ